MLDHVVYPQHYLIVSEAGFRIIGGTNELNYVLVLVQVGDIIAANIYREDDKPLYKRGNRDLIAINVLSISLFIFTKIYYVTKNKIREKKWNAMTPEVWGPTLIV